MWWSAFACAPNAGAPLRVDDEPVPGLVLARRFDVRGGREVAVECTSPDQPEERHQLVGTGTFDLYGLLADTAYECAIAAGDEALSVAFHTEPLPDTLPTWRTTVGRPVRGYTLFNHGLATSYEDREAKLLIVDPEGRLRWYFFAPQSDASDLDAQYLGAGRVLYGGGYAARPTIVALDGEIEASAPLSSTQRAYHHHAEQIADGTVWSFTVADNASGAVGWNGFAVEVLDELLDDRVWSWTSQDAVDLGWLPVPADGATDPYHANALQVVDEALYINSRNLSRIVKLDRWSGAYEWSLGEGQDFTLVAGTWFGKSHAPEVQADGRLLVYDNRLEGPTSRIVELQLDEAARTATVTWEWTEDGWFEPIWGDVDRLPDGHVLITQAHNQFDVPSDGRTALVEVDPTDDAVVWRLTMDDEVDAGYRAARIDGCAIFANEAYCPAPSTTPLDPPATE